MLMIFSALLNLMIMNEEKVIFDFSSQTKNIKWNVINDVVMGGISQSSISQNENGFLKFSGNLSPENNGGFASVRTSLEQDFSEFDVVIINVKGDGKIYSLRFRTDKNFDGVSYQANFIADKTDWKDIQISFSEFEPVFRGRVVTNQPELMSNNIKQIGFLIADRQFGEFELDIKWIKFFKRGKPK